MTIQDKNEFKQLVKEGTIEALKSEEGKSAVMDIFVEGIHEVLAPVFEDIMVNQKDNERRIGKLEEKIEVVS